MTSADLFAPFDLHGLKLPNRILMSAMTRTRATEDDVPTDLISEYYVQRASAGLIVTECTQVSDQGHGIIRAPGIHRPDQIAAWRKVTDAVHAAGGHIYNQIWHCGRVAHPDMRGGELPVAPSAIPATGDFFLPSGRVDFPTPRALGVEEIAPIVETFAQATRNAREAGFDGVELHGANGYLQDQFLQDGSNQRTDDYGGSVAHRARFTLETVDAMVAAWSPERVGVRLSPSSLLYGMHDSDPLTTFSYVIRELSARSSTWRRPSARSFPDRSWSTPGSTKPRVRRCWRAAMQTSSPSVPCSSPTRTCRIGSGETLRSTSSIHLPSMVSARKATPTIPASPRNSSPTEFTRERRSQMSTAPKNPADDPKRNLTLGQSDKLPQRGG